jgi:hypothetical protein
MSSLKTPHTPTRCVTRVGLAADERRSTRIENQILIRVHPCSSAAKIDFPTPSTPAIPRLIPEVQDHQALRPRGPRRCAPRTVET